MDILTKESREELATKIRDEVYVPVNTYKTAVFLCGGDLKDNSNLRFKISEALSKSNQAYLYDLIYPEDIFDELLYSPKGADLLSLENLLAESVDAVVVIPESPGSFAELGAFTNVESLRKKLICVIDDKYKKHRSFINKGPVKIVRQTDKGRVVYINPDDIDSGVNDLFAALRKIKRETATISKKPNLLQVHNFLLPVIYLLEPIRKEDLIALCELATENTLHSYNITITALTTLIKNRMIELSTQGYRLTSFGHKRFLHMFWSFRRKNIYTETMKLDALRLEILNLRLRKKKLTV